MLDKGVIRLAVVLTAAPAAASLPCPVLDTGVDPLTPALVPIVVALPAAPVVPEADGRPVEVVLLTAAPALFTVEPPLLLACPAGT